jgi:hypothetical protein
MDIYAKQGKDITGRSQPSTAIRELIHEKRRARRRWQKSRNPLDKRTKQANSNLRSAITSQKMRRSKLTLLTYHLTTTHYGKPQRNIKDQQLLYHRLKNKTEAGHEQIKRKQTSLQITLQQSLHQTITRTTMRTMLKPF